MLTGRRENILIVDDVKDNLLLLRQVLKKDYEVSMAASGKEALARAVVSPQPDLILLDIMMPEMNGYMVMGKLKKNELTADIPVIFLTAMGETKDETKGFMLGAADYIVKPIQPSIVKARVRTQLQLRQANRHIKGLYDETLTGIIELLNDVLTAANPVAYSRASRIRLHMKKVQEKLGLESYWEFDLAAMLSQIGCVTLDAEILEKLYGGQAISRVELDLYDEHPRIGQNLLKKIPHFEKISAIIGNQNKSLEEVCGRSLDTYDVHANTGISMEVLGVALLKIALTVEQIVQQGNSVSEAFRLIAARLHPIRPELAALLEDTSADDKVVRALEVNQIRPGMVLEKDLYTQSGLLLLSGNTPISATILERITAFHRGAGIATPVLVSFKE